MEQPSLAERPLIKRLARHLAAGRPDAWPAKVEDAASILAILKQPDAAMREAGDEGAWRAMIDAALRMRWDVAASGADPVGESVAGADEEGEIALTPDAVSHDRADWTHVQGHKETSS